MADFTGGRKQDLATVDGPGFSVQEVGKSSRRLWQAIFLTANSTIVAGNAYSKEMKPHSSHYSIAYLLICMTAVAACLGAVVSPNMWTTSAAGAVRMLLCALAFVVIFNRRKRCPRLPVAYLASSIAYAIADPWHADSEVVRWTMRLLNRLDSEQAMIGLWHIWSLIWILLSTLLITVLLKPEPLHWQKSE